MHRQPLVALPTFGTPARHHSRIVFSRCAALLPLVLLLVGCDAGVGQIAPALTTLTPITLAPDPAVRLPPTEPLETGDRTAQATELRTLVGHTKRVTGLAFSPGGARLASVSEDRTARLWDVSNGKLLQTIQLPAFDLSWGLIETPMVMASEGRHLIVSDAKSISRINLETGEFHDKRIPLTEPLRSLAISSDGKWLVAILQIRKTCLLMPADLSTNAVVVQSLEARSRAVAFVPGSDRFVVGMTADEARVFSVADLLKDSTSSGVALPWSQRTQKPIEATAVSVSADGTRIAVHHSNHIVRTGPVPGNEIHKPAMMRSEMGRLFSMAFLPGNRFLALDGGSGYLEVSDCDNVSISAASNSHLGASMGLMAPDARISATGLHDGTIKLFTVPQPIATEPNVLQQIAGMKNVMDFDGLEELAATLRNERPTMGKKNGTPMLAAFYEILADPATAQPVIEEGDPLFAEQYLAANPDSATARVVLARSHIRMAWAARGGGSAFSVTPHGAKTFRAELSKANLLLNEAAALEANDPEIFSSLILVSKGLSQDRELVDACLRRGQAIDPAYYPLYEQMAEYLLPRWHGKPGELQRWASETADAIGGDDGLVVYAHIANRVNCFETLDYMRDGAFSLERLKAAVPVLSDRFGNNKTMLNFAAFCACLANDPQSAEKLFDAIGKAREDRVWRSDAVFDAWKKWSQSTLTRGQEVASMNAAFASAGSLAFQPDGKKLHFAHDGTLGSGVDVFDVVSRRRVVSRPFMAARMKTMAYSHDSSAIGFFAITPEIDRRSAQPFFLWRMADNGGPTQVLIKPRENQPLANAALDFSPDGTICFIADMQGQLHRVDALRGTITATVQLDQQIGCLTAWDNDRLLVSTSTGLVESWDFSGQTEKLSRVISGEQDNLHQPLMAMAVTPDGKQLFGVSDEKGLVAWSLPDFKPVSLTGAISQLQGKLDPLLAFSPDNRWLVTCRSDSAIPDDLGYPALVWDRATMQLAQTFAGHAEKITASRFSPDSKLLATSSQDGTVKLWDVAKHAMPPQVESASK